MNILYLIGYLSLVFAVFFLARLPKFRFLEYSSLHYLITGVLTGFFLNFFGLPTDVFTSELSPLIEFSLASVVFLIGSSFRFMDIRFNETIVYKVTLFDLLISTIGFLGLFYYLETTILNIGFTTFELIYITIIFSVASVGVIRFVNLSIRHHSNIAKIGFESVMFQQLPLFFAFLLVITVQTDLYTDLFEADKSLIFLGIFASTVVFGIIGYLLFHRLEKREYVLLQLALYVILLITIYREFGIVSYLPLFVIGIFFGNTVMPRLQEFIRFVDTREVLTAVIILYFGLSLQYQIPETLPYLLLGIIMLMRYALKWISQRIAALFIQTEGHMVERFYSMFIAQGRSGIVFITILMITDASRHSVLIAVLYVFSLVVFDLIGKRKYENLIVDEDTIKRMGSES